LDETRSGVFGLHSTRFDEHEVDVPVGIHFFGDRFGEAFQAEFTVMRSVKIY
jgi:hypothetical protein